MLFGNFYLVTIFGMTKLNLPVIVFFHYIGQYLFQFSLDRIYVLGGSVVRFIEAYLRLGNFNWFIMIYRLSARNFAPLDVLIELFYSLVDIFRKEPLHLAIHRCIFTLSLLCSQ